MAGARQAADVTSALAFAVVLCLPLRVELIGGVRRIGVEVVDRQIDGSVLIRLSILNEIGHRCLKDARTIDPETVRCVSRRRRQR